MAARLDSYKRLAAETAVELVESGMVVGLGYGSTALHAVRGIAERLEEGDLSDVVGVPCSRFTREEAKRLGIPLTTLQDHPVIDLTIDGADEVDPKFNLIKGGGGALLREKIVAQASRREIIVVDETKLVPYLGSRSKLPIEVSPFAWRPAMDFLTSLGAAVKLRRAAAGGYPFKTDQGNVILDADFGSIADPYPLAATLEARAAILAHGLFLGLATDVIVAGAEGVQHLNP